MDGQERRFASPSALLTSDTFIWSTALTGFRIPVPLTRSVVSFSRVVIDPVRHELSAFGPLAFRTSIAVVVNRRGERLKW